MRQNAVSLNSISEDLAICDYFDILCSTCRKRVFCCCAGLLISLAYSENGVLAYEVQLSGLVLNARFGEV